MTSSSQPLHTLGARLWRHIGYGRRRQSLLLLGLMVATSLAEVMSIGAVLPFLGALAAPEKVFDEPTTHPLITAVGLSNPAELILPLTLAFCAASILAGGMRVALLKASLSLSFGIGADISNNVYRRTLYQPYAVHVKRNSSEVINAISIKTNEVIFFIVMPALNLLSAVLMSVAVIAALAAFLPLPALAAFALFGLLYALLGKYLRRRLKKNSERIARESTNGIRLLQEGLGGIRDILTNGTQEVFCNTFRQSDEVLRAAQRNNQFIAYAPRFGIETAGMVLIAGIALVLARDQGGVSSALPMLAALALGLQRLLPSLQLVYQSWSTIQGAQDALRDTLALLDQPLPSATPPNTKPLAFNREIRLRHLSFRYDGNSPWILQKFDLVIPKGSRMGFVGITGSGKSTLLDIIMGLLHPTSGEIAVDGVVVTPVNVSQWRARIAHVPQSIFLADASIRQNIAFGVPPAEIDDAAVRVAASKARISDAIESWPNRYDTFVGERGVQLSGGQRQRIGIARAFYKQADVLIFDEATSALDTGTEEEVMEAIDELAGQVTILLIAHRLSTLKNCSQVIELTKPAALPQPAIT